MSTEKKMWHDTEEKAIQCLITIIDYIQGAVERSEIMPEKALEMAESIKGIATFAENQGNPDQKKEEQVTLREKLEIEHPEWVSEEYIAGCSGCPGAYWKGYPKVRREGCEVEKGCEKCWSMPYTGERG